MTPQFTTVVIENLSPLIEGGRYPIKRAEGQDLTVEADVFMAGHDVVYALLKWRKTGAPRWHETPMKQSINDRWSATLSLFENAPHEFTIEAWVDAFRSWQHEFHKKFEGGLKDLASETLEGAHLIAAAAQRAKAGGVDADAERLGEIARKLEKKTPGDVDQMAHWSELEALMASWPDRSQTTEYHPYGRVEVDRERALFAAWYEFFPRSAEGKPDSGSTFRDCLPRIDDAKAMGFDVIYFPPIHPIGTTNRKGRNNSTTCEPGEPGVPYAIGNRHLDLPNGGGHKDIEPALGTFEDFKWLIAELKKRDMELALDFAINCSPDHPYVADHPDWFFKRPDGSIKYAENPPKKYEDVYPLNFFCEDWRSLWDEMADIILFWCEKGVRTFRVDNPHTKPVAFWEYLIAKVREQYPDAIFLSEAFTRPKMMKTLAQCGLSTKLHLLYLAELKVRTHGVFHRADADGDEGLLQRQSFHEHARYSPLLPSDMADARPSSSAPRWRPRFQVFTASTADSSFAKTRRCQTRKSIPTPKSISSKAATGMRRATSRTTSRG